MVPELPPRGIKDPPAPRLRPAHPWGRRCCVWRPPHSPRKLRRGQEESKSAHTSWPLLLLLVRPLLPSFAPRPHAPAKQQPLPTHHHATTPALALLDQQAGEAGRRWASSRAAAAAAAAPLALQPHWLLPPTAPTFSFVPPHHNGYDSHRATRQNKVKVDRPGKGERWRLGLDSDYTVPPRAAPSPTKKRLAADDVTSCACPSPLRCSRHDGRGRGTRQTPGACSGRGASWSVAGSSTGAIRVSLCVPFPALPSPGLLLARSIAVAG